MTVSKTTPGNNGMRGPCNDSGTRALSWSLALLVCVICSLSIASTAEGATVRDDFDAISYSGNNGTVNWTGNWIEFGESNGPSAGFLQVVSAGFCTAGNCMRLGIDGDNDNKYLYREVGLTGAAAPPTRGLMCQCVQAYSMCCADFKTTLLRTYQAVFPHTTVWEVNLGNIHLARLHYGEAIESYLLVQELRPDSEPAHYNLGVGYFRQGELAKASKEWTRALQLKPDFPETRKSLDVVQNRMKQR